MGKPGRFRRSTVSEQFFQRVDGSKLSRVRFDAGSRTRHAFYITVPLKFFTDTEIFHHQSPCILNVQYMIYKNCK